MCESVSPFLRMSTPYSSVCKRCLIEEWLDPNHSAIKSPPPNPIPEQSSPTRSLWLSLRPSISNSQREGSIYDGESGVKAISMLFPEWRKWYWSDSAVSLASCWTWMVYMQVTEWNWFSCLCVSTFHHITRQPSFILQVHIYNNFQTWFYVNLCSVIIKYR